jgi:ERCC4-type nuclease
MKPIVVRDSREKLGYRFTASKYFAGTVTKKLSAGDYSIIGLEDYITIERKETLDELCANLGKERARFFRELERMKHIKYKFLIIEDYPSSIFKPRFSNMSSSSILGSLASIMMKHGVQVIFAGTEKVAKEIVRKLLAKAWDYYQDEQKEKANEIDNE